MNYSATLDLQGAINKHLRNSSLLTDLVGERIYDRVPDTAKTPYISFGSAQEIGDPADCIDGLELYFDIDVWSREQGRVEALSIAGVIRKKLNNAELDLDYHSLELLVFRDQRVLRDKDGVTTHVVLTFRALIEA